MSNLQINLAAAYPLKNCPTKCVLICLANFANDAGGSCYPSVEEIAQWCSLSTRGVQVQLRKLESKPLCLISRLTSRGRTSNRYQLHIPSPEPCTPCGVGLHRPTAPTLHAVPSNPARGALNPARRAPDPLDPPLIPKIKVQAYSGTPAVHPDPSVCPELGLLDQAFEGKKEGKRAARLELLCRFEKALGSGWANDWRKWERRAVVDPEKCGRVLDQVISAGKRGEIDTDPARYAECQWQQFRSRLPSFNPKTPDEDEFAALICECAGVHHYHLEFGRYLTFYRTHICKRKSFALKLVKLKKHPDRHRKNWHTIATANVQKEFPELAAA